MTKPLSDQIRAQIHAQLAALERAGLPVADAVGMLRLPREQDRVARVVRDLRRGQSLADAGASAGLFTPLETAVLRAAMPIQRPCTGRKFGGTSARVAVLTALHRALRRVSRKRPFLRPALPRCDISNR